MYDYEATREDETSLVAGGIVSVLEKTDENWWKVESGGKDGYVPSSFLKEMDESTGDDEAESPTEEVGGGGAENPFGSSNNPFGSFANVTTPAESVPDFFDWNAGQPKSNDFSALPLEPKLKTVRKVC